MALFRQTLRHISPARQRPHPPYSVPIGADLQLIILDSAAASDKAETSSSLLIKAFAEEFQRVARLARDRRENWLLLHHALMGYGYSQGEGYFASNPTLWGALKSLEYPGVLPQGITMVIQGHIHTFELNRLSGGAPISLLTGFAGAALEPPFPEKLPAHLEIGPGVEVLDSLSAQQFGYAVLERQADGQWRLQRKNAEGKSQLTCLLKLMSQPASFDCQ
jgi:hypothetical protein